MSMTHLISILIGLYSISVEGKEFFWWYKLKPLEVWSIIETVRSQILCHLTLWELGYDIFVPKTSRCQLPYQRHSSSINCARELFRGSNGLANHLACTRKKFFGWGLQIFCEWRHKWSSFWAILAHATWPRVQPLGQSISLKFHVIAQAPYRQGRDVVVL